MGPRIREKSRKACHVVLDLLTFVVILLIVHMSIRARVHPPVRFFVYCMLARLSVHSSVSPPARPVVRLSARKRVGPPALSFVRGLFVQNHNDDRTTIASDDLGMKLCFLVLKLVGLLNGFASRRKVWSYLVCGMERRKH